MAKWICKNSLLKIVDIRASGVIYVGPYYYNNMLLSYRAVLTKDAAGSKRANVVHIFIPTESGSVQQIFLSGA